VTEPLSSWNWGQAKDDIIRFVERTCGEGTAKAVTVEERIAVFENDGTLWCEKPMPVLVDDILCGSSRWRSGDHAARCHEMCRWRWGIYLTPARWRPSKRSAGRGAP